MQYRYLEFYKLNYDEQSTFLASLMELSEPLRRRVEEGKSRRNVTINYFFSYSNGKRLRVCKKMVCLTYQVTQRRVQILVEKLKNGNSIGDQRGKHSNRPHKIVDAEKQSVMEHIVSFPSQESHYGRSTSKKNCLSPDLTLKKMYNLYQLKYPDSSISYNTYRHIFNTEFHIRFGFPRTDTCKICDKYYVDMTTAENPQKLELILRMAETHHKKADKAYSQLKDDSNSAGSDTVVICVDLQQVILTPNLTHSDVYYQRQYSNYNFAVHNMGMNIVQMYTWHERVAKRGAAEIASCILKYISSNYNDLLPGEVRKLIIWSDRCVGQNNNWTMIALCQYLIKTKYFTEINQKFLTSGHSFLPCDRDFALIEKKKKTARLYVPEDVCHLIESARPSNPFKVYPMLQEDFKNFNVLLENINRDTKCKITEGRWLQITDDNPEVLRLRRSHGIVEVWSCYSLNPCKRGRRPKSNSSTPNELQVLRNEPIEISSEKKKDLLTMALLLPQEYAEFYNTICI